MKKILPLFAFFTVLAIGVGMTLVVYRAEKAADKVRINAVADIAVDSIRQRVEDHIAFLFAVHSFFVAQNGAVPRDTFKIFVDGLNASERFDGVQGIGFARLIATGQESRVERELAENYRLDRKVWPASNQELRAPIVLLEPQDARNGVALGYDMYSEHRRRQAMQAALRTGKVQASAPVELVQETSEDKQAGFLVYIPLMLTPKQGRFAGQSRLATDGFVYAPFRAGDLHHAALKRRLHPAIAVRTADTTEATEIPLFESPDFGAIGQINRFTVLRSFDVAGRQWTVTVKNAGAFRQGFRHLTSFALGAVSILLAAAIAISTWSQLRTVASARQLQALSETAAREKDLMLQEMKHRIKNSIARVLAMARQTAAASQSLDEFSSSFTARLQSMANAQDLLTRSTRQQADLRELLRGELEQVFGADLQGAELTGPPVKLTDTATEALGLTFHELATNAMKYGRMVDHQSKLSVSWTTEQEGRSTNLVLHWTETSVEKIAAPSRRGFGTKLIDAKIKGELNGKIERTFRDSGLAVRISIGIGSM